MVARRAPKTASVVALLAMCWTSGVASAADAVTPEKARARLIEMAETLGNAKAFSVEIDSTYDAVQADGRKVEFGDSRKVLVRRPDGLRIDVERSDGETSVVQFDGKAITVATTGENVYAQAERTGTLDDAVRYFRQELKMQLPLAAMLLTTFRQEIENRLEKIEYVESTRRFGAEADHFAAQGGEIDAQFWVTVEDPPLLQRVVITYKQAEGQPQYAATFEDWNLSARASGGKFEFEPAKGARKIAFASQLVASAPKAGAAAASDKEASR